MPGATSSRGTLTVDGASYNLYIAGQNFGFWGMHDSFGLRGRGIGMMHGMMHGLDW